MSWISRRSPSVSAPREAASAPSTDASSSSSPQASTRGCVLGTRSPLRRLVIPRSPLPTFAFIADPRAPIIGPGKGSVKGPGGESAAAGSRTVQHLAHLAGKGVARERLPQKGRPGVIPVSPGAPPSG